MEIGPAQPLSGHFANFNNHNAVRNMSAEQKAVPRRNGCREVVNFNNVLNQIGNLGSIQATSSSNWNGTDEGSANLRNESERLKTFESWPVKFLESAKLASAGFYYLKRGDKVRCAFCGVEIGDWRPGDDPMDDHARWSGTCEFVKKEAAGNITLHVEDSSANSMGSVGSDSGYDTCGPYERGIHLHQRPSSQQSGLTEDPLTQCANYLKTRPPSFPDYACIEARLRSYDTWPISLKLKPNVLSEAGFFYTGKGDQTICYHCGGGLKDWEENDEPWVEHARWFSKCPFVISLKGKDFVDEVCGKKAEEDLKCAKLNDLSLSSSTGDLDKVPISRPIKRELDVSTTSKNVTEKSEEKEESSPASSSVCSRSSSRGSSDALLCKICYAEDIGAVFIPCGHMVSCLKCALSMSTCAICRQPVTAFFRAFLS